MTSRLELVIVRWGACYLQSRLFIGMAIYRTDYKALADVLYLCTKYHDYTLVDNKNGSFLFVLLDSQRSLLELSVSSTQEVHLLDTVLALDTESRLVVESELALVVDAKAGDAGTLGSGAGVRDGQGNGVVGALDGVEVLPASGSLALSSVANLGVLRAAVD